MATNGIDAFRKNTGIAAADEVAMISDTGDNMAKAAFARVQEIRGRIAKAKAAAVKEIDEKFAEELHKAEADYVFRVRLTT